MDAHKHQSGHFLRALRKRKNVGIKTAAQRCGIDYTYLSRIENGQRDVKPELVEKLCAIYGADPADVLARLGQLPPDILDILRTHGDEALDVLRRTFSKTEPT